MATLPSPFTASGLEPAAWRRLTDAEIRWNAELIEAEGLQQRRGSASAATPATPAAATAPAATEAGAKAQEEAEQAAKQAAQAVRMARIEKLQAAAGLLVCCARAEAGGGAPFTSLQPNPKGLL